MTKKILFWIVFVTSIPFMFVAGIGAALADFIYTNLYKFEKWCFNKEDK